jgi:hypothetical protein
MFNYLHTHGFLPECSICTSKDVENEYPTEPLEEDIICGSCILDQI